MPPKAKLTLPKPEDIEVTQAHTVGDKGQSPAEARESFMTEAEFERGIASQMQHQYDRMSKALSNFSDRWKMGANPTTTDYRELQTSLKDDPERLAQMEADWAYINSLQDYFEDVSRGARQQHAQSPEDSFIQYPAAGEQQDPSLDLSGRVSYFPPSRAADIGHSPSTPAHRFLETRQAISPAHKYTDRAEYLEGRAAAIEQEFPEQFDEGTKAEAAEAANRYKKPSER
tara:strand:+ start:406 stop:1092 length:687 start_codon:yes stop_codon:yes gene_type:complete